MCHTQCLLYVLGSRCEPSAASCSCLLLCPAVTDANPLELYTQTNFLLEAAFLMVFYHGNRKIIQLHCQVRLESLDFGVIHI